MKKMDSLEKASDVWEARLKEIVDMAHGSLDTEVGSELK